MSLVLRKGFATASRFAPLAQNVRYSRLWTKTLPCLTQVHLPHSNGNQLRLFVSSSKDKSDDMRRKIVIEIDGSKVEQSIRRELERKVEAKSNAAFSFRIDRRAQEEIQSDSSTAKKKLVEAPLYRRVFTAKYWKGLWSSVVHEAKHYWAGFKLLGKDVSISVRYLRKVLNGEQLSRRERRQFVRTASDVFRLVPFSVFIIVPGAELLLPFAIKFFPGLLPSQFQEAKSQDEQLRAQLKVKLDMAKFLQDTVEDMAVQTKEKDVNPHVLEFMEFLSKARNHSADATTQEILKFSTLFKDELTLDTLSRDQLRAMCRILDLQPIGTNAFLRYQLRTKLRSLKSDDLMIVKEGIDSLSVAELQASCRERGMRALGISKQGLKQQLQSWLDLHITHQVPSSLLVLSRILYLPEKLPTYEKIRYVVEALPETLKDRVKVEVLEAEGARVDARLRLEILADEEAQIKEETEEEEKERKRREDDERRAQEAKDDAAFVSAEEELERKKEQLIDTAAAIGDKALELEGSDKKEDTRLTLEDCVDLALVIDRLSGHELEDFDELKEDMEEHKVDLEQLNIAAEGKLQASVGSMRLSKKVESMVDQLEKNINKIEPSIKTLDLDSDGVISREELLQAMANMKNCPSEKKMRRLSEVLDADHDGKLRLDVLQKVLDFIEQEGQDVHPETLATIVKLVENESHLEEEQKSEAS